MFNPVLLERVFDLRRDRIIILKVLREGPAQCAHALLLLLYGYHQVKKEYVLATELYRSADQSGSSMRGLAKEYARNHRYVVQGGRGKGSNYSLNSEGLATAKEIMATVMLQGLVEERSNKLLEAVLACVSAGELLVGKLLGISAI